MTTTQPTKQQVREWFHLRQKSRLAPGAAEEIRRQLGWGLVRPTSR